MTNQTKTIIGVIVFIIVIVIIVNWNKWFGKKNGTVTSTGSFAFGGRINTPIRKEKASCQAGGQTFSHGQCSTGWECVDGVWIKNPSACGISY